jgi:hypothetical protein
MYAIKQARKRIRTEPESPTAACLSTLVIALENKQDFPISWIYDLPYKDFELALEVIREWRMDRHYSANARYRLLDMAVQHDELQQAPADEPPGKPKDNTKEKGKSSAAD